MCPAGYYCLEGSFTPTPCPAGSYSVTTGLREAARCRSCDKGSYCSETVPTRVSGNECVLFICELFIFVSSERHFQIMLVER